MKARFYGKKDKGYIKCHLCPHNCMIAPGKHGVCKVRFNRNGELELPFYGRLSSIATDPIEKKPLYHFYPGQSILSVGFVGCSFKCPFCQNYRISQSTDIPADFVSPEDLVELTLEQGSFGLAYTYSEPLIHLEYILDTARPAKEKGLKNVLVSNGYINPEPASSLLEVLDAANIDLKTFNPEFYRREIGGKLEEVKRFLSQAADKISLEITTLVIPTKNDSTEEIARIARFIASLNPDIPYHLSAYYPQYRYRIPATSPVKLRELGEAARKYLRHVYLGNIGLDENNTVCSECGNILVRRRGYSTSMEGIEGGKCSSCGSRVPIAGV